jgi:SAM-dependent methyltransferase
MHLSAMKMGELFFRTYFTPGQNKKIVEIGSQDVNGSLRTKSPKECEYIGVDFVAGNGVNVILKDPYQLPFANSSVDAIVCSSCFEHSEMFWVLFLEILRILKPEGLFYLNVPANGRFHRYPVDCWRFYPDSGNALVAWAKRNGMQPMLLESFVSNQMAEGWNDFVAVFVKDESFAQLYPNRILKKITGYTNGIVDGQTELMNETALPEDQRNFSFWLRHNTDRIRRKLGLLERL